MIRYAVYEVYTKEELRTQVEVALASFAKKYEGSLLMDKEALDATIEEFEKILYYFDAALDFEVVDLGNEIAVFAKTEDGESLVCSINFCIINNAVGSPIPNYFALDVIRDMGENTGRYCGIKTFDMKKGGEA